MAGKNRYEYKGKVYPPPPSTQPPQCTCHQHPVVIHQQCPRCITAPPPQPNIGFNHPNRPVYHHPPRYPVTNPARPPAYVPRPAVPRPVVPRPSNQPPIRGGSQSYSWVAKSSHGGVPSTAVRGGHDIDGATIYVGRAFHEGDWIPAKVIPDRNVAYVAYGGGEHAKHQYQVLCGNRFNWQHSSGGHIPPRAVEGGTAVGERLYVGRVHHSGACTVGKVHPSHGVCYIPFDGKEIGHRNYEILVLRS